LLSPFKLFRVPHPSRAFCGRVGILTSRQSWKIKIPALSRKKRETRTGHPQSDPSCRTGETTVPPQPARATAPAPHIYFLSTSTYSASITPSSCFFPASPLPFCVGLAPAPGPAPALGGGVCA